MTAQVGGTLIDERAGFRALYTGMTRGRQENVAYVVCENGEPAREVLERALSRDRADLGVLAHMRTLERSLERQARERQLRAQRPPEREVEPPGIGIEL